MPTSYLYQINTLVELIVFVNPESLLDIGVGFGKYGFLSREYLELREDDPRRRRIEGVEIFEDYLSPLHRLIYDRIYVGEATKIVPELSRRFDLILLIDVLEHLEVAKGRKLLLDCQERGRNLIVSTPKRFHPQQAVFGNPHERHRSLWNPLEMKCLSNPWIVSHPLSWICFSGEDTKRVRSAIRKHHRALRWSLLLDGMKRPLRRLRDRLPGRKISPGSPER